MTINQLKYFITVAECLNFTEAGKRHFISQTAITQHIQALEEDLNTKLLTRDRRHVALTPAGEVFLLEARAIMERIRIAVDKTEKAATGSSGNLIIGYTKGLENTQLGATLKLFHEKYPNIQFQLYRKSHLDLMMELDNNKIDLVINIGYPDINYNDDLCREYITAHPLYAVLYPSHPYAQLSSISRYDLRNESFFLTKYYDDPMAKNKYIPDQFAASGFIPKVAGYSSDLETIMMLVSAGIGISIMPEPITKYVKQSNDLIFIPLIGEHEHIDVYAFWKKSNTNPAIQTFLDILKESKNTHLTP